MNLNLSHKLAWFAFVALMSSTFIALSGCSEKAKVQTYTIPQESLQSATSGPDAILAAILPRKNKLWFFKLTGTTQEIQAIRPVFDTILKSVEFNNDEPTWKTPKGWEEDREIKMRFATLRPESKPLEGDSEEKSNKETEESSSDAPKEVETKKAVPKKPEKPKLEIAISSLPRGEALGSLIVSNINRWRRQLGKPTLSMGLALALIDHEPSPHPEAMVFYIEGRRQASRMPNSPLAKRAPVQPRPLLFTYEAPKEWEPAPTSSMAPLTFSLQKEGQTVTIRVTQFEIKPTSAMDSLSGNSTRWRGQVGLAPLKKNKAEEAFEKLNISELPAHFLSLDGKTNKSPRRAMRVGMLIRDETVWFFKLEGDFELVQQTEQPFREFLKSVKFN